MSLRIIVIVLYVIVLYCCSWIRIQCKITDQLSASNHVCAS